MTEFTHGTEAEVNGMQGFALGVETLEDRIAPTFLAIGISGGISLGGSSSSS